MKENVMNVIKKTRVYEIKQCEFQKNSDFVNM